MLLTKRKLATAVLLLIGVMGVGAFAYGTRRAEPQRQEPARTAKDQDKKAGNKEAKAKQGIEELRGVWSVESFEYKGRRKPAGPYAYTFDGERFAFTTKGGKELYKGAVRLDAAKRPRTIDLTVTEGEGKGECRLGIYEIDGDTLKMAFRPGGKVRPTELETSPATDTKTWFYKRKKAK
jgi:uncharacterized protein (TIGR03067 family)